MKSMSTWLLVLVALAMLTGTAQALEVTCNGGTVFYDDYEGVTPSGGDDDPVASTGTWTIAEPNVNTDIQVVNGATPGPFEGNNYLKMLRSGSGGGTRNDLLAGFSSTPSTDDVIHVEFMAYVPSESDVMIYALSTDAGAIGSEIETYWNKDGAADGTADEVWHYVSGGSADTGLRITFNTWQKHEIDYVAGASTITLTIDGNSASLAALSPGAPVAVEYRAQITGQTWWIDAVPEPATLVMLGLGGLATLLRRRRA